MKTKIIFASFCVFSFYSWTLKQENEIKKAEWLTGTWENKTLRGSIYETWTKVSEVELSGKSYMIKEKDTILFETVQLLQERDSLFYHPRVKNQNHDLPVRFAGKIVSGNELVFENLNHDFPQFISYTKISADSLVAEISGIKNGKERKQTFPMKRIR
jgi:hypothetical protein